jgi:hypothetical protein
VTSDYILVEFIKLILHTFRCEELFPYLRIARLISRPKGQEVTQGWKK